VDLAEGQPAREAVQPGLQVRRRLRLAGQDLVLTCVKGNTVLVLSLRHLNFEQRASRRKYTSSVLL
jgi:hypothetical protein